jgi:hypothetical protein
MVCLAFIFDGNGARLGSAFVNAADSIEIGIRIGHLIEPLLLADTAQPITSQAIQVVPGVLIPAMNRILTADEEQQVFAQAKAAVAMLDGKGESDAHSSRNCQGNEETRRESATVH